MKAHIVVAAASALVLVACSAGNAKPEPAATTTSASPNPTATPEPTSEPGESSSDPLPAGSVATVYGFSGNWDVTMHEPDLAAAQQMIGAGAVEVGEGEVALVVPVEVVYNGTSNTDLGELTFTYIVPIASSDGFIEADPTGSSLLEAHISAGRPVEGNLLFVVPESDKPGTWRIKGTLNDVGHVEGPPALATEAPTTPAPATEAPASADGMDVSEKLVAANAGRPWVGEVVTATQTQFDRIEVETTIVDPRGDNGSPAALQAIAVCEGTVALLQSEGVSAPHVSIYENDGSTYVLYGHPSYPGGCKEV